MVKRSLVIFMLMISCWAVEIYGEDDVETAWKNYKVTSFSICPLNGKKLEKFRHLFSPNHFYLGLFQIG